MRAHSRKDCCGSGTCSKHSQETTRSKVWSGNGNSMALPTINSTDAECAWAFILAASIAFGEKSTAITLAPSLLKWIARSPQPQPISAMDNPFTCCMNWSALLCQSERISWWEFSFATLRLWIWSYLSAKESVLSSPRLICRHLRQSIKLIHQNL